MNAVEVSWPRNRLAEALEQLGCRLSGARVSGGATEAPVPEGPRELDDWLVASAARLGLEAESVQARHSELTGLARSGPALLCVGSRLMALLSARRGRARILCPDLKVREVDAAQVAAAVGSEIADPVAAEVDALLEDAGIRGRRRAVAHRALLRESLSDERIAGGWLLRAHGGAPAGDLAKEGGLARLLALLVGSHAMHSLLWIAAWAMLGRGALEGRLDRGWLLAWGVVLLTIVPFRVLTHYTGGLISVRGGALLKRRLLFGALRMDPEHVKGRGAGHLLGRVIESELFEQMVISGGFLGITAVVELVFAAVVLGMGSGGWTHVLLLASWTAAAALLGWEYFQRRRTWTDSRLSMTNDLVESMVGHRTRLAQQAPDRRHGDEDRTAEGYEGTSRAMDRSAARLDALVPRGWFLLGIAGLAPAFIAGSGQVIPLAIGLGGVLLAYQAFGDLAKGIEKLIDAAVAWRRVRPFWRAAEQPCNPGLPGYPSSGSTGAEGGTVLEANDLVFRYPGRPDKVLRGTGLTIREGDRILLEGRSGGGKSTLGSVLAGCRDADSGSLLLRGLDRVTLGDQAWRRRVVIVSQFHDNHVLQGSMAFNVLMGRAWPPGPDDLAEAERICRALGLGMLLDRMPAGLQQPVGETGWQLSHGERSRLFIARAILQDADVIILDESFAALDPATLNGTLEFVLSEAPALVAIAHR